LIRTPVRLFLLFLLSLFSSPFRQAEKCSRSRGFRTWWARGVQEKMRANSRHFFHLTPPTGFCELFLKRFFCSDRVGCCFSVLPCLFVFFPFLFLPFLISLSSRRGSPHRIIATVLVPSLFSSRPTFVLFKSELIYRDPPRHLVFLCIINRVPC